MNNVNEQIIKTEYADIMQKSYIDYAMSVIVSRALPDVRDGLKPVQRRTLYDMHELGIRFDRPYRKCARIVGDTMGKYHPHGDSSIYEALVVMAQEFKKGRVLVDGHGNFGSIEGDSAAAMRYTEARLTQMAQEVYLSDLDLDIVNFVPNFDETEKEPEVLPVRIPNLLVNGAEGIAVGMATSIPPHNLGEVIDAVCAYLKNPEITVRELMKFLPGPDFPTGGIVANKDELAAIYETGQGRIRLRGRIDFEKGVRGAHDKLVITEIPYTMVGSGIGKFLNDTASLIENRKTTDILDISNQSSKEGIRIVLELKRGADIDNLKSLLYKKTRLEDTFGVNMLAVADGRPETLNLKQIIEHHCDFRFELCRRKYQKLLEKEQIRREIQEGLIKACDVIDLIIEILRGSDNVQDAKACLTHGITDPIRFKTKISGKMAGMLCFTDRQAQAILDMRLAKLVGLEIEALMRENRETLEKITRYEDILNNYDSMLAVILDDLKSIKKSYKHARKTVIENGEEYVFEEAGMEEQEVVFLMDRFGYGRTVDVSVYERNKEAADLENRYVIHCKNTGKLCIFTDTGKMHAVRISDLPYGKFRDKGQPVDNVSNYNSALEQILYVCDMEGVKSCKLLFVTQTSMVKRVDGAEFEVTRRTIEATKLADEDKVICIGTADEHTELLLWSQNGYVLRFKASDIPGKKRAAIGVRGMKLSDGDAVDAAYAVQGPSGVIVYREKELPLSRFKPGTRDTKGTKVRL